MLDKFVPEMLGSLTNQNESAAESIVSITPAGEDEYLQIEIDASTMVVEGYAHHNCYLHDEAYLNPQTNRVWRGVYMLNEVQNGELDEMPVSLAYLKKRYERRSGKA
jgi:hypothetical protein